MAGTLSDLWWHPIQNKLLRIPNMIGQSRRIGGVMLNPQVTTNYAFWPQALMDRTEVLHVAYQVHEWLKRLRVADHGWSSSDQDCQTGSKGGVQAFKKAVLSC